MNEKAFLLFSLSVLFSAFLPLFGQGVEDSLFFHLDKAHLVVRLPGQQKKMQAMRATIAAGDLSESAEKRMQAQLEQVAAETEAYNKTIIRQFQAYFKALPLHFVYDTTHHPDRALTLDAELQPARVELSEVPIIQLRFGRPSADSGNRPESMVLADRKLRDLGPPFPKPLPMTGIGFGINKLLAPEIAVEKLLEKRIKKLDRLLRELE